MGSGWWGRRWGGGPMSRVQHYGRRSHPARPQSPPPLPQQAAAAAVLRGGGSGETRPPLLLGPSLDSGEGKETRQGEARSNANQQPLFMSALNSKKENAQPQAGRQRVWEGASGVGGRSRQAAAFARACTRQSCTALRADETVVASAGSRQRNTPAPRTFNHFTWLIAAVCKYWINAPPSHRGSEVECLYESVERK